MSSNGKAGGGDEGLEAGLASLATPRPARPLASTTDEVIPGQLDLLQQLHPNDDDDSQEHS